MTAYRSRRHGWTSAPRRPHRSLLTAAAVSLMVTSCSAGEPAEPPPTVATAAPTADVTEPIRDAQLTPGTLYRFVDVLPGVLDVDLMAADPPLYNTSRPMATILSPDVDFVTDGLAIMAAVGIRVPRDPYSSHAGVVTPADALEFLTPPPEAPERLLSYLGQLPFVEVTVPERPFPVGGVDGRAVDVRIRDLPPEAEACGAPFGVPDCAHTISIPGVFGYIVEAGNALRFIEVVLPSGAVLIQQNLDVPAAQAALEGLTFVERAPPGEFAPARLVPFGGLLDADEQYVHPTLTPEVAVTFDAAPDGGRAIAGPGFLSILEQLGRTRTMVVPMADLRVGDPGPDPTFWALLRPLGIENSQPLPEQGLVDWFLAQPWVEVVEAPASATVGGLPGRTVAIRAGAGAPTLPCDPYRPAEGVCVASVFGGTSGVNVRLGLDEVLHVAEVTVDEERLAVMTRGDDPTGGSLQFQSTQQ